MPTRSIPAQQEPPVAGFCDGEFSRGQWLIYYRDSRFEQRYIHNGRTILCETLMHARAPMERALELLDGRWDWWDHGLTFDYRRFADGSTFQVLGPAWCSWTRVELRIYPPSPLDGEEGMRVPIMMSRHFVGPASIDVLPDPTRGGIMLRGRFHHVLSRVPFVPHWLAERLHMRAEAGNFCLPFPRGTGWRGLLRRLEPPS